MAKKENDDKIELTKEDIEEARNLIKSVVSPKEKVYLYGLAGLAAVASTVGRVIPQFASKGYGWLGGKMGADFTSTSMSGMFDNVALHIYERISYKMQNKILRDYDTRPEMEQKMLNPEKIANYAQRMGECAGMYMMQNAKQWVGYTGAIVGTALTFGGLSVAPLPMTVTAVSSVALGGLVNILCLKN